MQLWRGDHRPTRWDTSIHNVGYGRRTKCEKVLNREKVHKSSGRLIIKICCPRIGTMATAGSERSYRPDTGVKRILRRRRAPQIAFRKPMSVYALQTQQERWKDWMRGENRKGGNRVRHSGFPRSMRGRAERALQVVTIAESQGEGR
jgi:hypothetical protein